MIDIQQALVIPCISQVVFPTIKLSSPKQPAGALTCLTFASLAISAIRLAFVFGVHQYLP